MALNERTHKVETLLTEIEQTAPTTTGDFNLWVPNCALTLRGQIVQSDVAMAIVLDKMLSLGFWPAGSDEREDGISYRYSQES